MLGESLLTLLLAKARCEPRGWGGGAAVAAAVAEKSPTNAVE